MGGIPMRTALLSQKYTLAKEVRAVLQAEKDRQNIARVCN